MALLNLGDDPWLMEYDSCEKLQQNIMEQLSQRQATKSLEKFASLSANIRIRLKQYNNEVIELRRKLDDIEMAQTITNGEKERRSRQVEVLMSKYIQMQKMFEEHSRNYNRDRTQLIGSTSVWGPQDDELIGSGPSRESVTDLRNEQKLMLEDQERGLENLSNIIARQKNIAQTIHSEVDLHNDIIDDLGEHIDRTDVRIASETRHVGVIDRKDKTCVYWVVIVLLFISIIVVVSI